MRWNGLEGSGTGTLRNKQIFSNQRTFYRPENVGQWQQQPLRIDSASSSPSAGPFGQKLSHRHTRTAEHWGRRAEQSGDVESIFNIISLDCVREIHNYGIWCCDRVYLYTQISFFFSPFFLFTGIYCYRYDYSFFYSFPLLLLLYSHVFRNTWTPIYKNLELKSSYASSF